MKFNPREKLDPMQIRNVFDVKEYIKCRIMQGAKLPEATNEAVTAVNILKEQGLYNDEQNDIDESV